MEQEEWREKEKIIKKEGEELSYIEKCKIKKTETGLHQGV
jgi:hypothetical protein